MIVTLSLGQTYHVSHDSLIAYWDLDISGLSPPDAPDLTGNGFTMSNYQDNVLDGDGVIGRGAYWDGTVTHFTATHNDSLDVGDFDFTVTSWVKTTDLTETQVIYTKGKFGPGGDADANGFTLYYTTSVDSLRLQIRDISNNTVTLNSSVKPAANTWYFVAGQFDASANMAYIYVNGTLDSAACTIAPKADNTEGLTIGNTPKTTWYEWKGFIDEVGRWNRKLTNGELELLYNNGNGLAYPFSGTYYVDADQGNDNNIGSSETDAWATISKVNGFTFNAGDSICFRTNDTWREQLTVPSSGSSGSPIVFTKYDSTGESGSNPILCGADTAMGWDEYGSGVWRKYFTAEVFSVWDNDSAMTRRVDNLANVVSNAGHFLWLNDSIYLHVYDDSDPTSNGREYEVSARTENIDDNGKDYITIDNISCIQTGGSNATLGGIKLTGSNNTIQNCSIYDHRRHGLSFYTGCDNSIADNCTIYHSYSTSAVTFYGAGCDDNTLKQSVIWNDPPQVYGGGPPIRMHGAAERSIIEKNKIYDGNTFDLIDLYDAGTDETIIRYNYFYDVGVNMISLVNGDSTEVYNNVFLSSDATGSTIFLDDAINNKIYNNSFYNTAAQFAIDLDDASTTTLIKNNVIYSGKYIAVEAGSVTNTVSGYNIFYGGSGNFFNWSGSDYNTFANWKSNSSQDANSLNSDPLYTTNGSDFTLQSTSPAINVGVNLGATYDDGLNSTSTWPSSVTTLDQDDYGSWEIGAYIYGATAASTPRFIQFSKYNKYKGYKK